MAQISLRDSHHKLINIVALNSLDSREVVSSKRSLLESELFDAKELMKSIAEEK